MFALAVCTRFSFSFATGESGAPSVAAFEGDAPKWLRYLKGEASGPFYELPFDPPAMPWLLSFLSDGEDLQLARWAMLLAGALVAPLVYAIARRELGERVGVVSGVLCAFATNLVVISSGLHVGAPFLLIALLGVEALQRLRSGPASWATAAWFGATQAGACLFRVDHLLFVALALAWLALRGGRLGAARSAVAAVSLTMCLLPYQLVAADEVAAANERGLTGRPPSPLPLPGGLPWDADALAEVQAMPAFARDMAFVFVDQTMRRRGAQQVRPVDLGVLDEAFGSRPEHLRAPTLTMYGPFNFALANHPASDGGFTRQALDDPPPLRAGLANYPAWLAPVLEPGGPLRLDYPPHLQLVNHGYALGLRRLSERPSWALELVTQKLARTASGVATGFGGYAFPVGLSGFRPAVDLVEPRWWLATLWSAACLALACMGAVAGWRRGAAAALVPWLLLVISKFVPAVVFFGYARFGALTLPAACVLWALAADILIVRLGARTRLRVFWALVALLLAAEVVRCAWPQRPVLTAVTPSGVSGGGLGEHQPAMLRYEQSPPV